jgi:hypothetical protein
MLGIGPKTTPDPTEAEPASFPYRTRDDFLSPAEHSFYQVLKRTVGDEYTICPKVSLADLFYVLRPNENVSAYNRINRKHVDFVMCDPTTMRPRFAIELDDRSHGRADREERDEFVEQVFAAANLPLVRIPAQAGYSALEIQAALERIPAGEHQPGEAVPAAAQPEPAESFPPGQPPLCPRCGTPMVLRVARNGDHAVLAGLRQGAGKQFYGCPNYPKCRGVVAYQN